MALCNLARIRTRVISLLLANRLAPYTDAVGGNSRYPVITEFTDTILEVDAAIMHARLSTPGDPHRTSHMILSGNLPHGGVIPMHIGAVGDIEVEINGGSELARYAKSRSEVMALRKHPLLYPGTDRWAFVEDGKVFHNATYARVWYPSFTKTAVCQAPEVDELAEVAGTLGFLPKDGAVTPEIYDKGAQYFQWYIETQIKGNKNILPEVEVIERQLAT